MHAIRLRGPWEYSIGGTSVAGRIDFPCSWRELTAAIPSAAGKPLDWTPATLLRRFHRPTGLEAGDRVLLSLAHCGQGLTARLNGAVLELLKRPDGTLEADITGLLADQNELAVDLAPPSPALLDSSTPLLEATLEIHSA